MGIVLRGRRHAAASRGDARLATGPWAAQWPGVAAERTIRGSDGADDRLRDSRVVTSRLSVGASALAGFRYHRGMRRLAAPTSSRVFHPTLAAAALALAACTGSTVPITGDGSTSGAEGGGSSSSSGSATTLTSSTTSVDSSGSDSGSGGSSDTGAPGCNDGVSNEDETDVDCGGPTCDARCQEGQHCVGPDDCASGVCTFDTCRAASCDDGVKNGDETDVNCGGPSCPPCGDSLACNEPADCQSELCDNGACTPASCADGLLNGSETDVDCGGSSCPGCPEGGQCEGNDDCSTLYCEAGNCLAVDCLDDGDCADLAGDCAVGACNQVTHSCVAQPAFSGQPCDDGSTCTTSYCVAGLCGAINPLDCSYLDNGCNVGQCNAGIDACVQIALNDGDTCDDFDVCTENTTCTAGACINGDSVDCSYLDNGCQVGACNQFSGECYSTLSPDFSPCDDGFACSTNEQCLAGACVPDNLVPFWGEDFADNDAGWTLGTAWEIGSATASACPVGNPDPAMDHTDTDDNGVAGVELGDCAPTDLHDFYCLTSPVIDTTVAAGPLMLQFYRWLNSDYTPYMQNLVEVWDGSQWVTIWSSDSTFITDADWVQINHSLNTFVQDDFQFRICNNVGSGGVYTIGGWNLDDVALLSCP